MTELLRDRAQRFSSLDPYSSLPSSKAKALMTRDARHSGTSNNRLSGEKLSYADAGVDIDAGEAFVEAIKPEISKTDRPGVMGAVGGFGALFDLGQTALKDPILVSGTDGVGSKLLLAAQAGDYSGLGQDLVAMCTNDILCQGAKPLFFLDYLAAGRLSGERDAELVSGIAAACRAEGAALVGGETAELPGLYAPGHFDLAGFAVGAVERGQILPRYDDLRPDDVLIGLASSGIHSNGFSLVRRLIADLGLDIDQPAPFDTAKTLRQTLLAPTTLYGAQVHRALDAVPGAVKALCHVTGGGLPGNLNRVLRDDLSAQVDPARWQAAPIFGWLEGLDRVERAELFRTFNMGLGMVLVVDPEHIGAVMAHLAGESPVFQIGTLAKREAGSAAPQVLIEGVTA